MAQYKPQDHYYKKAKAAGHASRAVYKLEELHQRFKLFETGDYVLDLGCAPGSWLQYTAKVVGPTGKVMGIDRLPISIHLPPQVTFIRADLENTDPQKLFLNQPHSGVEGGTHTALPGGGATLAPIIDCVLSDMAPNTSGVKFQDQCRSFELGELAWTWAQALLKPGGNLVIKLLYGEDVPKLVAQVKAGFQKAQLVHTQASRKGSTEIYIVAMGKK